MNANIYTSNGIRKILYGAWRRPEARLNGVQEVAGSNPVAPIFLCNDWSDLDGPISYPLIGHNGYECLSQQIQSCVLLYINPPSVNWDFQIRYKIGESPDAKPTVVHRTN